MNKRIIPTVCSLGLVFQNINMQTYSVDNEVCEKKESEDFSSEDIYIVEDLEIEEYEKLKENTQYVEILDENLLIAINKALNKDDLYSKISYQELISVEELVLSSGEINDIKGLEFATSLKKLDISFNNIEDISPLQNLFKLEEVNLSNNNIKTLSPLKNLTNLKKVDLSNSDKEDAVFRNEIEDVDALLNNKNLIYLNLLNNNVSDMSSILEMTNLEYLNLSGNKIVNLKGLDNLKNLNYLNLSNQVLENDTLKILSKSISIENKLKNTLGEAILPTYISNGGVVEENTTIIWNELEENTTNLDIYFDEEILYGSDNKTNFTGVITQPIIMDEIVEVEDIVLKNEINLKLGKTNLNEDILKSEIELLTSLKIDNKELKSLKGIEYATNLEELYIENSNVQDFNKISNLYNIKKISLRNNSISNISFLKNLYGLEEVKLNNNDILDVSNIFDKMIHLKHLDLSNNKIYEVKLENLPVLSSLDLSDNCIFDISNIINMDNLEYINLNNNNIKDISALSKLESLKDLSVENQKIYLPKINSNYRLLNIKNPIIDINGSFVNPSYISQEGKIEGDNISWNELDSEFENLEFDFNNKIEYKDKIIGTFSGTVLQPLDIDLFAEGDYVSLSLSTNQIKFEDFDGFNDVEKVRAIDMNIESNKAYNVYISIPHEIVNSDGTETLSVEALSVKDSQSTQYLNFKEVGGKILLLENMTAGNNTHSFDFRLNSEIYAKKESYRAVVKFEINQI